MRDAYSTPAKQERQNKVAAAKAKVLEAFSGEGAAEPINALIVASVFKEVEAKIVRWNILDTKKRIDEIRNGLKDGSFAIWKGPIADNTGKVVLAKDAVADDKFLEGIMFYVKGVEGKVPSDKK